MPQGPLSLQGAIEIGMQGFYLRGDMTDDFRAGWASNCSVTTSDRRD
jgi:hypothetical protein